VPFLSPFTIIEPLFDPDTEVVFSGVVPFIYGVTIYEVTGSPPSSETSSGVKFTVASPLPGPAVGIPIAGAAGDVTGIALTPFDGRLGPTALFASTVNV
jgi:hypothetical protein